MNAWTIIQARTGSARRPGKVLAEFPGGPTMLDAVYHRARQIGPPVALTIPDDDTVLEVAVLQRGWDYVTGPEDDVVKRFAFAAERFDADTVVRVTGDCPFLDVEAAQMTLRQHLDDPCDMTTYHLAEGRGVQVFSRTALRHADYWAKGAQRDSPDIVMLESPFKFRVNYMKFSVDTPEELDLARRRADGGKHGYESD